METQVRNLIKNCSLTLSELSLLEGVSLQAAKNWSCGINKPPSDALKRLELLAEAHQNAVKRIYK